jgi:hypothetical protein
MNTIEISRRMLQAENLDLEVANGVLIIRVALGAEPRDSKSGASSVIASTNGTVRIWDESGLRAERLNLNLYIPKPLVERPFRPRRGRLPRVGR